MDYHSARWCNLLPIFLGIKFKKIPTKGTRIRIKTAASNLESIVSNTNETRRMIRGFDGESAYVLLTKCGAQLDDGRSAIRRVQWHGRDIESGVKPTLQEAARCSAGRGDTSNPSGSVAGRYNFYFDH